MRIDELSVQKKKGQSAENQLTVQIQELQDKANSLNDLREFNDPEMASSSGLFHVPSQPMSTPSAPGMLSRDSCQQLDTRNSFGTSGNVFEDPPALTGPPAAFFGNSRSHASARCELVSLNTGRLADRAKEMERNTQNFAIPAPRFARKFSTRNPPSHAEGAYPQNCTVQQPRNQVSEMHFDKFPNPRTLQRWKTSFKTEVCSCSNFLTGAMLWFKEVEMVDSVDDLETSRSIGGRRFPKFEMLDVKIASALKKLITNPSL